VSAPRPMPSQPLSNGNPSMKKRWDTWEPSHEAEIISCHKVVTEYTVLNPMIKHHQKIWKLLEPTSILNTSENRAALPTHFTVLKRIQQLTIENVFVFVTLWNHRFSISIWSFFRFSVSVGGRGFILKEFERS